MNQTNKGKAKIFSAWLCATMMLILTFYQNSIGFSNGKIHIGLMVDTIPSPLKPKRLPVSQQSPTQLKPATTEVITDTVPALKADTSVIKTIDTFSFKIAKGALDVPVSYHADDSMVVDVPNNNIRFYGKVSTIKYADNSLEAPAIEYDQNTNLVKANHVKDSSGKVIATAKFEQGEFKSESDTIVFNMKTQKGLTKGTYTQQG